MGQKIFITKSGKANITCPECGKVRAMDVSKFNNVDKAVSLKVSCVCGHGFSVTLERRLHVRKPVNLKGQATYRKAVNLNGQVTYRDEKYLIKILDISRMGMKLRAEKPIAIQKGEKLIIDFILDDTWQSRVEKEVIARKITGADIGVEFVSSDHYDRLGPYLLFHFS